MGSLAPSVNCLCHFDYIPSRNQQQTSETQLSLLIFGGVWLKDNLQEINWCIDIICYNLH